MGWAESHVAASVTLTLLAAAGQDEEIDVPATGATKRGLTNTPSSSALNGALGPRVARGSLRGRSGG